MFDALIKLLVLLSIGFPAAPWLFAARWGRKGIWLGTVFLVVALCFFPAIFWAGCIAANCGQGAIAIFVLGPIWIVAGLLTVGSAALAHYYFARRAAKPKRGPTIAE